ncbi:hypothetical protein AGMMS49991_09680 [Spirochaetia bacterium]|nr:hypothetical protein AGMMS49991_09680 [Spirochaetia bacterium]
MKKFLVVSAMLALLAAAAFAQEEKPYSVKVDIDADLFTFVKTDVKMTSMSAPRKRSRRIWCTGSIPATMAILP